MNEGARKQRNVNRLTELFPTFASRVAQVIGQLELQGLRRIAIDNAIAASDWTANVKVGWDPLHIEPTGITVAEARAGKQPQ